MAREIMAGRERKYTPRARTTRPIGEARTSNAPPNQPLQPPVNRNGLWFIPEPLSHRLHDKSALGQRTDGGILLSAEEVMFCHWYRHVPLPDGPDWFEKQLMVNEELAKRTIALDVLRNGGERVVPVVHLAARFLSLPAETWAIRWERHEAWTSHPGYSQVRLQRTQDELDWKELHQWVNDVMAIGHVAELCVIDEEFDTTIYHLSMAQPRGSHVLIEDLSESDLTSLRDACRQATPIEGGHFVGHDSTWPLPAIGLPHFSGRYLRGEEYRAIMSDERPEDDLYRELLSKGLLLRPGFKYGCRWRAYEEGIEVAHAPWLVQPERDAPKNWEEVCLAVRLAEGVNKRWICAQQSGDSHSFLNIQRFG